MTQICRTCAVERGVKQEKRWSAIGICPTCQEQHVLFVVELQLHPCDAPGCNELTADVTGLCPGCLAEYKAEEADRQGELEATRYAGMAI